MDESFWRERWESDRTPFHQSSADERLMRLFPAHVPDPERILVPLSGKSLDIVWLLENTGAEVVACELIEHAVRSFHDETGTSYERRERGRFVVYAAGRLTTWVGDFLELPAVIESRFDAVYDRASLVALPPDLRPDYARCIENLTEPGARYLLLALEYDQAAMDGPPFSAPAADIERLFSRTFRIDRLTRDALTEHPFVDDGVSVLRQCSYLLERR